MRNWSTSCPKGGGPAGRKFGRAVSLARKGDFQSAEKIYREQAAWLLSLDRKQELAGIYLEFADAYFKPAPEQQLEQQPDYEKALQFYNQALEVGPQPEKRAEVELLAARCYQALGKLQEAAVRFARFSKEHPDSELDLEARYRLGECQLGQNQLEEARRTWQDLLAAYAGDKSPRVAEAAFQLSQTWRLPRPQSDEELELGVASLKSFLEQFPEHKLAGKAFLRIASSYMSRGRFDEAVASIQKFLDDKRYADREEAPDAQVLLGRCYQLQKKFPAALEAWRNHLAQHPAHRSWSDVQRQIINTEFLLGYEAKLAKHYDQARKLWGEFLVKYPLDPRDPGILYEFGRMQFLEQKYDEAINEWRRLVAKYPKTNQASQAQFMIAATLEEKLGKLPEAPQGIPQGHVGQSRGAGSGAHRPADGQVAGDRHRARVPHERNAEDQADHSQRREGRGARLLDRHGDVFPQDAPGFRRGRPGHCVDRSRPYV